jgi:hypothetical protein
LANGSSGLLALDTEPAVFDVVALELNGVADGKPRLNLTVNQCSDTGLLLWVVEEGLRDLPDKRRQFFVAERLRLQPDGVFLGQLDGFEDAEDVFELLALASRPKKTTEILLRLLAGHAGLPLPACTELDDIIGRDFMREELRAVGQVLLEQTELVFQFPAGRVAQALALLSKDVGRNLVRDSRFLWLVRFGRDDSFAGIETTFEFSRFVLSCTK